MWTCTSNLSKSLCLALVSLIESRVYESDINGLGLQAAGRWDPGAVFHLFDRKKAPKVMSNGARPVIWMDKPTFPVASCKVPARMGPINAPTHSMV